MAEQQDDHDEGAGEAPAAQPPKTIGRRRFLQATGAVAAAGGIAGAAYLSTQPQSPPPAPAKRSGSIPTPGKDSSSTPVGPRLETFPIRPPAVPLAVRQPYLSTWLQATAMPGTWQSFWTGQSTAMAGIVRIDGASYMLMGAPTLDLVVPNGNAGATTTTAGFEAAMHQTDLTVTPTRSTFTLTASGVEVTVEFLSPVEPGDLRRQSVPFAYVDVSVTSSDDVAHDIALYVDASAQWCSGDETDVVKWAPSKVYTNKGYLQVWSAQLATPKALRETGQMAAWGKLVWATPHLPGLSYGAGPAVQVRQQFVNHAKLANDHAPASAPIGTDYPVFAFALDMGQVGKATSRAGFYLGQVRTPALGYLGQPLQPLWSSYWYDWQSMLASFHHDKPAAASRASKLDASITSDAQSAGGVAYEGLCAIALRQAYAGTELVAGPGGAPWAFLKDISGGGGTSNVDVVFSASPVWLYADPAYLSLLLEPLFAYAESGKWSQPFAEHDLGQYPNATGPRSNGGRNMPVEQSASMVVMAAAYAQRAPAGAAKNFLSAHYPTLKKWSDYLVAQLPDPAPEEPAGGLTGPIAHSVDLALKGILGVAAMGLIAANLGNKAEATHYDRLSKQFMAYWRKHAEDPSGKHLDLTYNGAGGGDGTWGTTYNAYADSLLGTGLIPHSVRAEQAQWYSQVSNVFGVPLQTPHSYAKADWEMLTAAWLKDYPIKTELIEREYLYANTTPSRVPFGDLYDTISGHQMGFKGRPVVGAVFALLALAQTSPPAGG